jgi:hypothetical protein
LKYSMVIRPATQPTSGDLFAASGGVAQTETFRAFLIFGVAGECQSVRRETVRNSPKGIKFRTLIGCHRLSPITVGGHEDMVTMGRFSNFWGSQTSQFYRVHFLSILPIGYDVPSCGTQWHKISVPISRYAWKQTQGESSSRLGRPRSLAVEFSAHLLSTQLRPR